MRRTMFTFLILATSLLLNAQNSTFNIIFNQNYENDTPGLYNHAEWAQDFNNPAFANGLDKTVIVNTADASRVMQWNYPKGSVGPSQGGGQWEAPFTPQDEVYMSYNIKFKPGFDWAQGGKLPGLRGGPNSYGPGERPGWSDGFSNGLMWGHGYGGQDDIGALYFYTYYQDMASIYGDCRRWGNFKFQTDHWYNVTIRMVMNTVKSDGSGGNADGIMEGFIDGKLLVSVTGLRLRNVSTIHIDKMKIYTFFGGSGAEYAALRDEWSMIDDVYMFTYADGVNVPRGRTPSPAGRILQLPTMKDEMASVGTVPATPSGLSVVSKSSSSASLSWNDNASDESGYRLERSTDGTNFSLLANLPANSRTFQDAGLTPSTKYYYRVRSFNTIGNSVWSNITSVTTDESSIVYSTPESNLLACWYLDNNGTDQTGHNYNLSFYNGAGFTADNKQGTNSLLLDGTNDYASSPQINLGDKFSIALWVKIPSGRSNIQTLLANGASGSTSNGFKLLVNTYSTSDRKIIFESGDGTTSSITCSNTNVLDFDRWNYIAVTVDRLTGTVKLFNNGNDVTSVAGVHKSFKNKDLLRLGQMTNNMFGMKGEIDHVDVYSKVLSANEILTAMAGSVPVTVNEPTGLTATSSNGTVSISWKDNADNESGFLLERSLSASSGFAVIKSLASNLTSFTDDQVNVNTKYYYRAKAVSDTIGSPYSNTASVVVTPPPPEAPTNLAAGSITTTSINLAWIDNADYEKGFRIERSMNPASGFEQIAELNANTTSYSDLDLNESTTYYYRAMSYNSTGNSAWSNMISVTTSARSSLNEDLFAYWPLDKNGSDLSGHGNDLTLFNDCAFTTDHEKGSGSIILDGTDDYAASPDLDPGNEFTLSAWINIPSGRSNIQTVLANGSSGSNSNGFKVLVNTYGTSDRKISFESGDGTTSAITRSDAGIFEPDRWNHIAITVNRTSGSVRIYYNGTDVTAEAGVHTSFKTSGSLRLGIMTNSLYDMKGQLDDVKIYARVLSPSEVMSSMNGISIGTPTGLSADNVTSNSVGLSWKDNADNEKGYEIRRSLDSLSGYASIAGTGVNLVSYQDTGLNENTTYFYRVRAFNSTEYSAWSGILSVKTSVNPKIADDMLAYWPLDNSGIDQTGHGYDLTLNGPSYSSNNQLDGSSILLDGTDDFAASPSMDPGNEFTLAMWVKIPSGKFNIQTLLANGPSGSSRNGFKVLVNTYGSNDRKIYFESGDGITSANTASNLGVFTYDSWNHVAVTVNRNTGAVKLFYNGADVTAASGVHNRFNTRGPLWLGRMTNNLFGMKGQQDDVRVYSRILSPSEILTLMESSLSGVHKSAAGNGDMSNSMDAEKNMTPPLQFVTYPNPFINSLSITNAGNIQRVDLIDLAGKVLKSIEVNEESVCTINTETLPSGIYLVKITGKNNFVQIQKVIRY